LILVSFRIDVDSHTFLIYDKYLSEFFLEYELFRKTVVEKLKTLFMLIEFILDIVSLCDNVENYGRARLATDSNKAQAQCMLDDFWPQAHTQNI
jgi:hypothetical protein